MQNSDSFREKLVKGQLVEVSVADHLQKLLPDCEVRQTDQELESKERDIYHLCDVVVLKDGRTVLGIECKRSIHKFRKCMEINGWDGDFNTPLNNTSIRKYQDSEFPFYVLNINQFCHRIFTADINLILNSRHDQGQRKPSGVIIYNFDSSTWNRYGGDVRLDEVLLDILRMEKLC